MIETVENVVTILRMRPMCECQSESTFHQPGECTRDGDETCGRCGKSICGECTSSHGPTVCIDCCGRN